MNTERIIKRQLKKDDLFPFSVLSECGHGFPRVISIEPSQKTISKTIYWLTCPYLHREIAMLENRGIIREMTEHIKSEKISDYCRDYQDRRQKLFMKNRVEIPSDVDESGIAGSKDGVKCLHAHYAYYIMNREYPIGRMIEGYLEKEECDDKRCERFIGEGV